MIARIGLKKFWASIEYFKTRNLKLNNEKTEVINFKPNQPFSRFSVSYQDKILISIAHVRVLGVEFVLGVTRSTQIDSG